MIASRQQSLHQSKMKQSQPSTNAYGLARCRHMLQTSPTSKEGLENYWRRIKNRPSPQVSPANSEDELSIGDAGEIADELSDEEEMEEGSVGEAEEEEESGELMFGDESGGEEDWDDGSDESDG